MVEPTVKPRPRITPERFLLAWMPFLCGAFAAGFALDSAAVVFGNFVVGLVVALLLVRSDRTTGALVRLLPRVLVLVLGVNLVVAVVLFVLDRV